MGEICRVKSFLDKTGADSQKVLQSTHQLMNCKNMEMYDKIAALERDRIQNMGFISWFDARVSAYEGIQFQYMAGSGGIYRSGVRPYSVEHSASVWFYAARFMSI